MTTNEPCLTTPTADEERAKKMFDAFKEVLSLEAQKIYQRYWRWFDPRLVQIKMHGNKAVLLSTIDHSGVTLQFPQMRV